MDGFPAGTPLGPPTAISVTGTVHFVAGTLGFISLAVSCLVAARVLSRRGAPLLARFSLSRGVAILLGFFGGAALGGGYASIAGIWFAWSSGGRGSASCHSGSIACHSTRSAERPDVGR